MTLWKSKGNQWIKGKQFGELKMVGISSFSSLRIKSASSSGAEVVLTEGLLKEDYSGACARTNSAFCYFINYSM